MRPHTRLESIGVGAVVPVLLRLDNSRALSIKHVGTDKRRKFILCTFKKTKHHRGGESLEEEIVILHPHFCVFELFLWFKKKTENSFSLFLIPSAICQFGAVPCIEGAQQPDACSWTRLSTHPENRERENLITIDGHKIRRAQSTSLPPTQSIKSPRVLKRKREREKKAQRNRIKRERERKPGTVDNLKVLQMKRDPHTYTHTVKY